MSGTPYTSTYFDYASTRLSYVGAVLSSRRELVRDWLATAFDEISTDAGFRTDPVIHKHFIFTGEPCHICVILDTEVLTAQDDSESVFDSELKVIVLGRFLSTISYSGTEQVTGSETDGEYLLDDMKRVLHTLMIAEVNTTANRRIIMGKRGIQCFGPTYFPNNSGECRLEFYVKLFAEGKQF